MAWAIGGVELSYGPEKMRLPKASQKEQCEVDGDYPANVNTGLDWQVQLDGTIPVGDAAKITSLLALVGTQVTIAGSYGALIDGDWNFDSFEPHKDGPGHVFAYTMRFTKGSENTTYG